MMLGFIVIFLFLATAGSDIKIGDILPTTEYLPKLNNIKIHKIQ